MDGANWGELLHRLPRVGNRMLERLERNEPFRMEITDALRDGDNQLEIDVVNNWVNRIVGDAKGVGERKYCCPGNPESTRTPSWYQKTFSWSVPVLTTRGIF